VLDTVKGLGLEAMEIGTGGYPNNRHCPLDDLVADPPKPRLAQEFEDRNLIIGALSCHGNPVHPDAKHAAKDVDTFRKTVLLAERLGVKVIVGFSGVSRRFPTDVHPIGSPIAGPMNSPNARLAWKEKVIPYWKEAAKVRSRARCSPPCLRNASQLRCLQSQNSHKTSRSRGEEIGANCDLSHLFWQGCDPVEVIHYLGKQGALYHAHMKDTVFFDDNKKSSASSTRL